MKMQKLHFVVVGCLFILWVIFFLNVVNSDSTLRDTAETENVVDLSAQMDVLRRLLDHEKDEIEVMKVALDRAKVENNKLSEQAAQWHPHADIKNEDSLVPADDNLIRSDNIWKDPIPILVFVCNRPHAIKTHVDKLIKYRPSKELFPIVVTQDCDNDLVKATVDEFGDQIIYIKHVSGEKANITEHTIPIKHRQFLAYYRIARHYRLALDQVFNTLKYTSVVITEDDLDIAPDFFEFFSATRYLLDRDPMLWCVSAWNDNGKLGTIDMAARSKLYRTDFFPGLGWMMSSSLWGELGTVWPSGFWDDWMREPNIRKGRQCIRPEISRTGMTSDGKKGASQGQFFNKHLIRVLTNKEPVKFTEMNLNYLLQEQYDRWWEEEVFHKARLLQIDDAVPYLMNEKNKNSTIRVEYSGNIDYCRKADKLHVMHDFKAGVPRTAYKGVVSAFVRGVRVYLVPDRSIIKGYDPNWAVPPGFGE